MIKYTLHCAGDHEFEGWFSSWESYEAQARAHQIVCPVCGSVDVSKALMTPNVVSGRQKQNAQTSVPMSPEVLDVLRKVRQHVVEHAEYVGPRFAEEARKIHHEEVTSRPIYGEATLTDLKLLQQDGIECHPLPALPEDHN
jgi:hypothetical protein